MNENSPICASAIATVSAVAQRIAASAQTSSSATSGLPTRTIASAPIDQAGRLQQRRADRAACRPRRRTARRTRRASAAPRRRRAGCSRIGRRPCPARNAPSAIETPKTSADPTAMPSAMHQHGQREQLARPRRGDADRAAAGMTPRADDDRERDQRRRPSSAVQRQREPERVVAGAPSPNERRQQHQREHGEAGPRPPASRRRCGRPACAGRCCRTARESARRCWPRPAPCRRPAPADQSQPNDARQQRAEHRGDGALRDRAGNGDAADGEQLLEMELQADAEHQQDDADLGQLLGEVRVGDEARRVRADQRCRRADSRRSARGRGAG